MVGHQSLKQELYEKQKGCCNLCGQSIDKTRLSDGSYVHLDHIEPYSLGGKSTPDNADLVRAACN